MFFIMRDLCEERMADGLIDVDVKSFLNFFSSVAFAPNRYDNRHRTILHNAASNGDIGVIKALILYEANMDLVDKDECSPLCIAIRDSQRRQAEGTRPVWLDP